MAALQRWPAFSLSLVFHVSVIGFILWVDIAFAPPSSPHYDVLAIPPKTPEDSKVIWYNSRKVLPEIAPDRAFGPSPTARGEKDPTRTLVTVSSGRLLHPSADPPARAAQAPAHRCPGPQPGSSQPQTSAEGGFVAPPAPKLPHAGRL